MQQFLLNDKVITELHMKTIDLKEKTKFAKKYDMPIHSEHPKSHGNFIHALLQKQRKKLNNQKNEEIIPENSPKTKNLLSTLKVDGLFLTASEKTDQARNYIKQSCFTVRGIKKSVKQFYTNKKSLNRTCSLVASVRLTDYQVDPYDVNPDLRFKRSPRCFIQPQAQRIKKQKQKFRLIEEKQNFIDDLTDQNIRNSIKPRQTSPKMTIKEMVDKEIQEQVKKRKAICRTAPTKHIQKMSARQQLAQDYGMIDDDICRVESKIYSEMRQNREKAIKRNKQRVGINIDKNKPFSSLDINKNTVKILKKYHCDNMVYFSKFVSKE